MAIAIVEIKVRMSRHQSTTDNMPAPAAGQNK
jgi:hypothetical protein